MISLPLPRNLAGKLRVDHAGAGMQPLGWWVRNELPRRSLVCVVDGKGVPANLRLTDKPVAKGAKAAKTAPSGGAATWRGEGRACKEQLAFKPRKFADIAALRGVPYEDTTHVEYELLLGYGRRTLVMQLGGTGPTGGPYWWQNVQVDRLWQNAAAQAVRVGGIIYN